MFHFPGFWKMLGAFFVCVSAPVVVLLSVWLLVGCTSPKIEYQVVPAAMTVYDSPSPALDLDAWSTCAISGYAAALDELAYGVTVRFEERCR